MTPRPRAALAKVLGTRSVDAGGGWLIFALPPAEIAVHPAGEGGIAGCCGWLAWGHR
jgi:hypothetical protein